MAMETEQLKKILAGLSLVSLLAGAGLTVTGCGTEGYGTRGGGGTGTSSDQTKEKAPDQSS
jgi:radical SAM modification target selenobiotic family peptide